MKIYIYKNKTQLGPFDLEHIQQGLQTNHFTLNDHAFTEGMTEWKPLQEVLATLQGSSSTTALVPSNTQHIARQTRDDSQLHQSGSSLATPANSLTSGLLSNPTLRGFLNEEQDPAAVARVWERLQQICTPTETTLYIAVQKKPVVTFSPTCVALTDKRVIIFRPTSLGLGLTFQDFHWRNVVNIHISEAVLGATFWVHTTDNFKPSVDSLPKAQARRLYQFGQQMEEQMYHHRRDLMLEEKRVGASQVNVAVGLPAPVAPQPATSSEDPVEKLSKLKKMLDADLISREEYDAKKAEIMARF